MRLVTFVPPDGQPRSGALLGGAVVDLAAAAPLVLEEATELRWDMVSLLRGDQEDVNLDTAAEIVAAVVSALGSEDIPGETQAGVQGNGSQNQGLAGSMVIGGVEMLLPLEQVRLLAPLPRPTSLRCFEGFEQHNAFTYRLAGHSLPPEWYRFPGFAFANHNAIYGPDANIPMPNTSALDYELEVACIIGREGREIALEEALDYIAGYTILNDWHARDIQAEEDRLGLGAAKARDFATSLGPWLVTPDELELYTENDGRFLLAMVARVNSIERSRGNFATIHYSFADIIAQASHNTSLYPGDVLSSGAVGSGCLMELTHGYGPWLEQGDIVELEVTGLGVLRNRIVSMWEA